MQTKLKYRIYGEFSDYEANELAEWIKSELSGLNINVLKLTIDWEPTEDAKI